MGKKHKKHKSDKHLYEEYVEKPLKLVLKVGGNEVTELSTGSSGHDSSLFEDRNDHDKHKDRKRKKRKKGEKQASGEEKGRKRRRVKVFRLVGLFLRKFSYMKPMESHSWSAGSCALSSTQQGPGRHKEKIKE
ncbi:bromodomain-containing protein 7-like isoform X3 [Dipodomys merriami]|uniref:bromodomain-containing protein 7-like isoform X3 n=1 Tax=Dipodomys merriami TaxID=94247 RepID=UPI003855DACE